jgi:hypothetical protein
MVAPRRKVTFPTVTGVDTPVVTVAVNVTGCAVVDGLGFPVMTVVVGASPVVVKVILQLPIVDVFALPVSSVG